MQRLILRREREYIVQVQELAQVKGGREYRYGVLKLNLTIGDRELTPLIGRKVRVRVVIEVEPIE